MNIRELENEQIKLAKKIIVKDDFSEINHVAGCSQANIGKKIISALVILDYKTLDVIEKKYSVVEATIPYLPGFLSYRESPAVVDAFSKLTLRPDLLMVNANGILHPRKIGMASHLGILLDIPTIGVAKKLQLGEEKNKKVLVDGETRAAVLRTKEHAKPIYVSPGHRISLRSATEIVKKCIVGKHKLPEPLHEAHKYANKIRNSIMNQNKSAEQIN